MRFDTRICTGRAGRQAGAGQGKRVVAVYLEVSLPTRHLLTPAVAANKILNFAANNFIKRTSIIILFSAKFLLVVFQFMELKKAHVFWKTAVVLILALVNLIIIFSLNE